MMKRLLELFALALIAAALLERARLGEQHVERGAERGAGSGSVERLAMLVARR